METLCRIRDIYRQINDFETRFQNKYSIGLNEGMMLCSLSKLGECSSGEIAEILGLTLSNTSKVILSAEKKGLVKRSLDEDDKRRMLFTLTESGQRCIDKIHCQTAELSRLLENIKEM